MNRWGQANRRGLFPVLWLSFASCLAGDESGTEDTAARVEGDYPTGGQICCYHRGDEAYAEEGAPINFVSWRGAGACDRNSSEIVDNSYCSASASELPPPRERMKYINYFDQEAGHDERWTIPRTPPEFDTGEGALATREALCAPARADGERRLQAYIATMTENCRRRGGTIMSDANVSFGECELIIQRGGYYDLLDYVKSSTTAYWVATCEYQPICDRDFTCAANERCNPVGACFVPYQRGEGCSRDWQCWSNKCLAPGLCGGEASASDAVACGDGICDWHANESDSECYADCHCGDLYCDIDMDENGGSCPSDCV